VFRKEESKESREKRIKGRQEKEGNKKLLWAMCSPLH
jgi:hypothetical protein